jgi:hypothetical protein
MPGVLVKFALVMERTARGPFLSVEDLVAPVGKVNKGGLQKIRRNPAISSSLEGRSVFDGGNGKKKRPTPRTTRLSWFVLSAFGNSGLTKDSK